MLLLTLSALLAQASPDFEVVDQTAFQKLFSKGAAVRKLAGDMKFIEGPDAKKASRRSSIRSKVRG